MNITDLKLGDIVCKKIRQVSNGWNGGQCSNEHQRKFIAQTYPIYREIKHFFAIQRKDYWSCYDSETLTCEEGGNPIKIKEVTK